MDSISLKHKSKLLILAVLISVSSFGQKLIESRQSSYNTYIYWISDKEAKNIYKSDIWKVDSTYFHTLVDSFPKDSLYSGKLPQGHYLKTFAEKNKQITSVTTFKILMFLFSTITRTYASRFLI